jgi:hypothetical protein
MTTLHERNQKPALKLTVESDGAERREHRRHDMELAGITVDRWDGSKRSGKEFGRLVDLSAGGVRIRTEQVDVKPDNQIRVRIELPAYAGISPFIDTTTKSMEPKREWVGWMAVARVMKVEGGKQVDVAGRLVDMDEMDRGMLGLYLSTQPLAA